MEYELMASGVAVGVVGVEGGEEATGATEEDAPSLLRNLIY